MLKGLFKRGGKKPKSDEAEDDDLPFATDDAPEEVPASSMADAGGSKRGKRGGGIGAAVGGLLGKLTPGGKGAKKGKKGKKDKKGAAEPDPFDNPELLARIASEVSSLPPPTDVAADEDEAPPPADPDIDGARHTRPTLASGAAPPPPVLPDDGEEMPDFDEFAPPDDEPAPPKRNAAVGIAASVVALLLVGGGAVWLFSGSPEEDEDGTVARQGLEAVNEQTAEDDAARTPQSGRSITMTMPQPTRPAPPPDAGDPGADDRSLARRPWLGEGAAPPDGAAESDPTVAQGEAEGGADPQSTGETPASEVADAAAAAPPGPAALPPEQRLAGAVDPMSGLPPLEDPLVPDGPREGHVVPSFERLPAPPRPPAALPPAPQSAVARTTPQGVLPVISRDGQTPWQTYARPFDGPPDAPRVAVIITGLGMDPEATEAAISRLPPGFTLSFSPYAPRLAEQVALARQNGHEVMLDLPLEGEDFPAHDPGPMGMLTLLPQAENVHRLEVLMTRAVGYTGFVGVGGNKFGGSRVHMRSILEPVASHGLLYVHAVSPSGVAGNGDLGQPIAVSLTAIDGRPFREAVDARLEWLEAVALQRGAALAIAHPLPVTFERLIRWAEGLAGKGIALAPASATTGGPSS